MPTFRYRAVTASGEMTAGQMEGADQAAVVGRLQAMGLLPVAADELAGGAVAGWRAWLQQDLFQSRRPGDRELAITTHQLATLLQANLPLDQSLATLVDLTANRRLRAALAAILQRVRDGSTLADAMAAQPGLFGHTYLSMVRAGELSASLEAVLFRLAEFLTRRSALSDTVRSALIYPAILAGMAGLSLVVIMTVVVPQLEPLFADAGGALPLSTRAILVIAHLFQGYWWLGLALLAVAALAIRRAARTPRFLAWWHGLVLRLPLLRTLVSTAETAKLSRTLGSLLVNGVGLPSALTITQGTVGNSLMAEAVGHVAGRLKEGGGLAEQLARTGLFSKLSIQLVRVGEETGKLDEMLLKLADIYDRDVQRRIERLLALLVPLLTIGLGFIVAGIVGSMLVAILSVNDLAH